MLTHTHCICHYWLDSINYFTCLRMELAALRRRIGSSCLRSGPWEKLRWGSGQDVSTCSDAAVCEKSKAERMWAAARQLYFTVKTTCENSKLKQQRRDDIIGSEYNPLTDLFETWAIITNPIPPTLKKTRNTSTPKNDSVCAKTSRWDITVNGSSPSLKLWRYKLPV